MRVIAGESRGRQLLAPPGAVTRPILDRVKLALFSRLEAQGRLREARVLDLYAGAGSLGIEALSRGAAAATFVEADARVAEFLRRNLAQLDLAARAAVRVEPAAAAVAALAAAGEQFDLVFFDPPFARSRAPGLGTLLAELERAAALLAPGGRLLLRAERQVAPPARVGGLVLEDRRAWGRNAVAAYRPAAEPPPGGGEEAQP